METIKQKQVAELVKRNFSMVLQDEGTNIYGATPLVTVTNVKVTPDLSLAKIYLSIYNTEHKQEVLLEMAEEKNRLKQALGYRLRKLVRRIPDVDFYLDDTLDEMFRIDELFGRLRADNQMGSEEE
ncbi:MAG TPA: 30S ribosome-binding factor RbfA [Haliscomenobacter sp.]|uniref:Ribosome-binding factor A n=1 Tax=Haliscomenobacter hydrossis (strain ATCC 27775 / DSM 1100 / LMG 10767 / O) TaxID=760192 RepID=F4KWB4_HALH1|nr:MULTISPECIES: 30S ribosome-binding factor RbfA [Haliscomenobacter]AEE50264.1 Ribosome-binding factor A [Haliscomenobacter hydrossis DSM 1100]MBK9492348.1 30S ribosome-binding factor RbfA [Haliscomenobacter sp.]HOY17417.1 30S ribosome-binding factor RbfA [Haliscomenobacter sp.]HPH17476.1 30S ribosome-binding factor RbfA [Haliscomenobacter sp.]